jgi:hypothetical protein
VVGLGLPKMGGVAPCAPIRKDVPGGKKGALDDGTVLVDGM